ncbi:unnamed protein product [Paramecium sonneborni]|uniref:Helicase C-terminal domain-containing protein n=1 Tax=Paramecium sonneborni TaxID=65129 RepID=A0A8S1QC96_9CILI|nr:unnamed protein product [Paramecium sonneborni]
MNLHYKELSNFLFKLIKKKEWKFDTLCDIYETITILQTVIFCSTKQKCEWLTNKMRYLNFYGAQMNGNMSYQEREKIMTDFIQGNQNS